MKARYAVIWKGKRGATVYRTKSGQWSLDASEAHAFTSWFAARFQAGLSAGAGVVPAWVDS